MALNRRLLFDAGSTNPISAIVAVAVGDCVQISAWNLAIGESAQVFRLLVSDGSLGTAVGGSCTPSGVITPSEIIAEDPYLPCGLPIQVTETVDGEINTIVIQQPGFYRLHLTPAALGTVIVEAIALTGADACSAALVACCCPETAGPTVDVCDELGDFPVGALAVGDNVPVVASGGACKLVDAAAFGSGVVFPLLGPDGACLTPTYSFASNPDTGMFLTATELTLGWNNCLSQFNVGDAIEAFASQFFSVSTNGASRLQIAASGEWEIPAGSPGTAGQVITSSGVGIPPVWANPTVTFPLLAPNGTCAAPSYSFTASPDSGMFYTGTAVRIGDDNCVDFIEIGASINITSTVSAITISAGTTLNSTSVGATTLSATGTFAIDGNGIGITSLLGLSLGSGGTPSRLVLESDGSWNIGGSNGTAGQVITSNGAAAAPTWQTPSTSFPLLAPNGSCAAPSYSFTASPDSGMWYDPAGAGQVVISDDNCVDEIRVGASITLQTTASVITVTSGAAFNATAATGVSLTASAGNVALAASASLTVTTSATSRLEINSTGTWLLGGVPGTAGQVLTTNGAGTPPTWQSFAAVVSFPLLAPNGTCAAPSYSFTASPDSGMLYDPAGAGKVIIGDDNCFDKIEVGASINLIVGGGHASGSGGGGVLIDAAQSITAAPGGSVEIYAGKGDSTGDGGSIRIESGRAGAASNNGGDIIIEAGLANAGNGGDITTQTGSSTGRGGRLSFLMGGGNNTVSSNHGEAAFVWGGAPASTNFGKWGLYSNGSIIDTTRVFSMDNAGDIMFHGSIGSEGTKHFNATRDIQLGRNDLPAAAAGGFPYIPRMNTSLGVPGSHGANNPIVVEEAGGTIVLHVYEFGTATWRSVTLV